MLFGTLGASLLGNILAGKEWIVQEKDLLELLVDLLSKTRILIPPHPLTKFEIQNYFQNEPKFNGVYSRDNLPDKIKDGAYVINLDEYSDIETHWIALYALNNNATYFDSFTVEHIPKEITIFIDKSIVVANVFRMQAYDSIMCGYFRIGFIDSMLARKTLIDFTNIFPPNNFKKNFDIILKYFMINV